MNLEEATKKFEDEMNSMKRKVSKKLVEGSKEAKDTIFLFDWIISVNKKVYRKVK